MRRAEVGISSVLDLDDERINELKAQFDEINSQFTEMNKGRSRIDGKVFMGSNLQEKVKETLDNIGLDYQEEEKVGPFLVDFVLPDIGKVIEVLGPVHYATRHDQLDLITQSRVQALKNLGYDPVLMNSEDINGKPQLREKILVDLLSQ